MQGDSHILLCLPLFMIAISPFLFHLNINDILTFLHLSFGLNHVYMKSTIYLLTFLLVPFTVFGQKKFKVTFILPDSTIAKDLSFFHWDMKIDGWARDTAIIQGNKAIISHTYHTVMADILAERQVGDKYYSLTCYTNDTPATVSIAAAANGEDLFSHYQLVNAQDFKKEKAEAAAFIKEDYAKYWQKYEQVGSDEKLYTNPLEIDKLKELRTIAYKKRMEYISRHGGEYFAFSLFMKQALRELPPDYLLQQFATIFPADFRDSEQGLAIKTYLQEREILEVKKKAPLFTVNDIDNQPVNLAEINKKKTVLLVFWGTWCAGCIAEIPMLKELREKYPKDKFEIISVAAGSKEEDVRKMVKEKGMDWVQVLEGKKIIDAYHVGFYPTLFLIDTKGNFAYAAPTILEVSYERLKKTVAENVGMN